MIPGRVILGEYISGDGDRSSSEPPVEPPVTNATVSSLLIQQTGVRIPSGDTTKVIKFVLVDPTDTKKYLTGLDSSEFSVTRVRESLPVEAVETPTIVELSQTLMPGIYSLLCDEDTTLPHGIDEQTVTYRITHALISPQTLEAVIYRPKITVGNTLSVQESTGWVRITNDGMKDIAAVLDFQLDLVDILSSIASASIVAPDNDTIAAINTYLNTEIPNLQLRIPELVDGRMPSDVGAIGGDNQAAVNLRNHALMAAPVTFLAGGTKTTAILDTIGGEALNNASNVIYKGASFVFTAPASLKHQRAYIQSYDASSGEVVISEVAVAVGVNAKAILV